jgi:predicted cupin superfamily sugar epimerase
VSAADKLATPEQVARAYSTTIRYVYKIASRDGWRKIRVGRNVHYHWDDAGKSLGK